MDKIKTMVESWKEKGVDITLLMLRDVNTKQPSISFTFFVISIVAAVLALFEKTKLSLNLGLSFDNCRELVTIAGAIYFGRKLSSGNSTVSNKEGE